MMNMMMHVLPMQDRKATSQIMLEQWGLDAVLTIYIHSRLEDFQQVLGNH